MEDTACEIERLVNASFAPATQQAYNQGIRMFLQFCSQREVDARWPVSESIMAHFVAAMSLEGKSAATVKTYLAGLSASHKLKGFEDPTDSFLIRKLLKGLARETRSQDSRLPITLPRLIELVDCLQSICKDSYETLLFKAAFVMAYFGCFRISELLGQSPQLVAMGGRPALAVEDIIASMPQVIVKLVGSKTDQCANGQLVTLSPYTTTRRICPVLTLADYFNRRPGGKGAIPSRSGASGPLFVHGDGSSLTQFQFQSVLKKAARFLGWPSAGFSSHSFRIGAATSAALNGATAEHIMAMGRWKSSAFRGYCRLDRV